jgi:YidC/Oxa1 family membrane protein insertase
MAFFKYVLAVAAALLVSGPAGAQAAECGEGEPGRAEWTDSDANGPLYHAVFSGRGGTIACFKLLHGQYAQREEKPVPAGVPAWLGQVGPLEMVTTWDTQYLPYFVGLGEEFARDVTVERTVKLPTAEGAAAGWKAGEVRSAPLAQAYRLDPTFTLVSATPDRVVYVWPDPATDKSDIYLEKVFTRMPGSYRLGLTVALHNFGKVAQSAQPDVSVHAWHMGGEPAGMFSPPPNVLEGLCRAGGSVERYAGSALVEDGAKAPAGEASYVAIGDRYFLNALMVRGVPDARCQLSARASGVITATIYRSQQTSLDAAEGPACIPDWYKPGDKALLRCSQIASKMGVDVPDLGRVAAAENALQKVRERAPEGQADAWTSALKNVAMGRGQTAWQFELFVGPKDISMLAEPGVGLEDSLDFWVLGFLSKPMLYLLRWFYSLIPHWAVAIILLTIVVKLALLYWTQKSYVQMQRMAQLKPAMEEVKKKYGNDKERMNQEVMNLYKREKVNPLGGCLPMLLQMPIWIALYRTIYSCVDLYQAPLGLWIQDLSAPDKYFVLPALLGVSMFVQQKMTPTSMDSSQAKMMLYVMPVMFTVFMLFLPSGLNLYIFVNTLLSMMQQYYLRKKSADPSKPAAAKA